MDLSKRIARLEAAVKPASPSWEEVRAAELRITYRAARTIRTTFEANFVDAQFTDETGPPYLWRASNLAKEASLLDGDSEEQEGKDNETLHRWTGATKPARMRVDNGDGQASEASGAKEKLAHALEKLATSLGCAAETEAL